MTPNHDGHRDDPPSSAPKGPTAMQHGPQVQSQYLQTRFHPIDTSHSSRQSPLVPQPFQGPSNVDQFSSTFRPYNPRAWDGTAFGVRPPPPQQHGTRQPVACLHSLSSRSDMSPSVLQYGSYTPAIDQPPNEIPPNDVLTKSAETAEDLQSTFLSTMSEDVVGYIDTVVTDEDTLAQARNFVLEFDERLNVDAAAQTTFHRLAKSYLDGHTDELELYAAMYCLMLSADCPDMLNSFFAFLPAAWRSIDLTWLNNAIEEQLLDITVLANTEDATEEKPDDAPGAEHAVEEETMKDYSVMPGVPDEVTNSSQGLETSCRKRRPRNAFRAMPSGAPPPHKAPIVSAEDHIAIDMAEGQETALPDIRWKTTDADRSPTTRKKAPAVSLKKTVIAQGAADGAMEETFPPHTTEAVTTTTPASASASATSVFGTIFPTRRSILARSSRPYIHAACGKIFMHPDEVKKHHKTCKHVEQQAWDDHPSCKIAYKDIRFTQTKDGFVLVDQESLDLIDEAIRSGLEGREDA